MGEHLIISSKWKIMEISIWITWSEVLYDIFAIKIQHNSYPQASWMNNEPFFMGHTKYSNIDSLLGCLSWGINVNCDALHFEKYAGQAYPFFFVQQLLVIVQIFETKNKQLQAIFNSNSLNLFFISVICDVWMNIEPYIVQPAQILN